VALVAIAVTAVAHAAEAGAIAGALLAPAVSDGAAKIHPSVRARREAAGGPLVVWVLFEDKGPIDTAAAIRDLERTYDPRAIERRRLRRTAPGLFDERDLPVHQAYVEAVTTTGATLRSASRWVNGISVRATWGQLGEIARLPFVRIIQPVLRAKLAPGPRAFGPPGGGLLLGDFYGISEAQLAQINLIALHDQGFTGQGVIVGALDTGFRRTHEAFNDPGHPLEVVAEWDFVNDDADTAPEPGDPSGQHNHGTWILGTLGAFKPGTLVAGAYDASFILAKVEDLSAEYPLEEDWFVAGLEFIEANGGDVATSSVVIFNHYSQEELDGRTSVMTVGFNVATVNGVHCCQGAGNDGHDNNPATSHLVPPADAFQVITCGAVDILGNIAGFSSDGPTADGRVKPEVLARGVGTLTVSPSNDSGYDAMNGTSLSTPMTASAVACLVQAHPDWTVGQMRDALFHTADYFVANETYDPLYVLGFGIIDALGASKSDPPPTGDLNGDGAVGINDLLVLLAAWGPCADCGACPADLNGDCTVGVADLLVLLASWG
jgi:subtilisin family serine protease